MNTALVCVSRSIRFQALLRMIQVKLVDMVAQHTLFTDGLITLVKC